MDITYEDGRKSSLTNDIAIHDMAPAAARAAGGLMSEDLDFFIALVLNGILIGLMYSLIALGFVLVYKATDAINFAQGEFVMLAGLIGGGGRWLRRRAGLGRRGRRRDPGGDDRRSASGWSGSCCGRCSAGRSSR